MQWRNGANGRFTPLPCWRWAFGLKMIRNGLCRRRGTGPTAHGAWSLLHPPPLDVGHMHQVMHLRACTRLRLRLMMGWLGEKRPFGTSAPCPIAFYQTLLCEASYAFRGCAVIPMGKKVGLGSDVEGVGNGCVLRFLKMLAAVRLFDRPRLPYFNL